MMMTTMMMILTTMLGIIVLTVINLQTCVVELTALEGMKAKPVGNVYHHVNQVIILFA